MISVAELRELSLEELNSKLIELRKEQFQQRMKKATGALDKTHVMANTKKSIARIKTIMTEKAGNTNE